MENKCRALTKEVENGFSQDLNIKQRYEQLLGEKKHLEHQNMAATKNTDLIAMLKEELEDEKLKVEDLKRQREFDKENGRDERERMREQLHTEQSKVFQLEQSLKNNDNSIIREQKELNDDLTKRVHMLQDELDQVHASEKK